ncbi:hypothetical protein MGWOODY_Mmi925 [hydrothermal vent metagenome]|uniref:Uncharacterized protein n=1 Tax=hydrothermal vent metagenome TaxID=652676 RepID=A0A160VM31_9ZZZZ
MNPGTFRPFAQLLWWDFYLRAQSVLPFAHEEQVPKTVLL